MANRGGAYSERDLGYLRILRELDELDGTVVEVGLQNDGTAADDGVLVAHYAAVNEFGGGHVPERSFMRSTFDHTMGKLVRTRDKTVGLVMAGKLTANTGAGLLGQMHETDIKRKIGEGVPPPNAPSTIKRKGSSKTLIDNATMRTSVRYVVRHEGGHRSLFGLVWKAMRRGL